MWKMTGKWLLLLVLMLPSRCIVYAEENYTQPLQRVAVIGGGMAGVSAATFLKDTNCQVYLFEASDKLGGHAQTVFVDNGYKKQVEVDLGPQYFSKGPWDLYIDFLKFLNLYNKLEMFTFFGGLTTSLEGVGPYFVSPSFNLNKLQFNCRIDKAASLYSFYRFNKKAYKLYKSNNERDYMISVGEWLNNLDFSKEDQENLLLPFLGSLIGVDRDKARDLSIRALVKLFAFSCPLKGKKFKIFSHGMGNLIDTIGTKLETESKNIHIKRKTPVKEVIKNNGQFLIRYERENGNLEEILVDKVITALHPFQLIPLLENIFLENDSLKAHLSQLEYGDNRIVLHHGSCSNQSNLSSVIEVNSNKRGVTYMTMNLGKVNRSYYGDIHKSWVNEDKVYNILNKKNLILAEAEFKHPVVTTEFVEHCNGIRSLLEECPQYRGISIAGGWTEIMETQATAILSGYKAVKRLYPDLMGEKDWENILPSLAKDLYIH